jgi:hypothetical protein
MMKKVVELCACNNLKCDGICRKHNFKRQITDEKGKKTIRYCPSLFVKQETEDEDNHIG